MNIEQLCRNIRENFNLLKSKKKALQFLKYQFELLAWKRQKLKLGAIVFEVKEIVYGEVLLAEEVDIRYIRQDNTQEDELKIENRLKALGWRWDLKNIGAFVIVFTVACVFLYAQAYIWYCENLPSLAYKDPRSSKLLYRSLELTLASPAISTLKLLLASNYQLIGALTDFCVNYGIVV